MAISSTGIGSGLDVNSIIAQLTTLEKRPLTALQNKAVNIQTKVSTVGQISAQVSALSDAAFNLTLDSGYGGAIASSANSSQVSASAANGTAPTSFSVEVSQLARAQSLASTAVVKDTPAGTGSLTIDIGAWDFGTDANPTSPPVFTAGTAGTVKITVGASENTLTAIAQKINDSGSAVVATILQDASGERLLIRSKATGEQSGFRIQAQDDDGVNSDSAGLSSLAFDPGTTASLALDGSQPSTFGLLMKQRAADSLATINGVDVRSSTTSVAEAVPGVTLQLSSVTTSPIEIRVVRDNGSISKNISAFVAAYNALNKTLADSTKYDVDTKTAGVLQGDSAIVGLRNVLRSVVTSQASGGKFSRLSEIGLSVQLGGNITVNGTKLDAALADPENLKSLLALDNGDGQLNGIARKVKALSTSLLSANGGVTNASDALQSQIKRNQSEQDKVNERVTRVAADLKRKYSALDGQIAGISSVGSFVSQWVTQLNK